MAVLIDSSVWIAADKKGSKEHQQVRAMIRGGEDQVVTCLPIQVEVCQGVRSRDEFAAVWDAFLGFTRLEIRPEHWELSAWNYFACKKKGLTLSTIDCLLATLAHSYRVPLWSRDKAFKAMRPVIGFDLFSPSKPSSTL